MRYQKRFLAVVLALFFAFGCLSPAYAVYIGYPGDAELYRLESMKYGFELDRVIVTVTDEAALAPMQADPQYKSLLICKVEPSKEYFDALKNGESPAPIPKMYVVVLNTDTKEALDAFIEKYKNAPGVESIEYDRLLYTPEERYAVRVDLKLYDEFGLMEPIYTFSPTDFSYAPADSDQAPVKTVYVSARTGTGLTMRERKQLDDDPNGKTLSTGIPTQLILETAEGTPAEAAALALELLDFENSTLFSEAQKKMFSARLQGVDMISYNGKQPLEGLVRLEVLQLWIHGDPARFWEDLRTSRYAEEAAKLEDAIICSDVAAENQAGMSFDRRFTHCYVDTNDLGMEIGALAEILDGFPEVYYFSLCNRLDAQEAMAEDASAAYLLTECAYRPGDLNGDKKVTAADARLALRSAVGIDTVFDTRFKAADTNADGKITAGDARSLLRIAVGLESAETLSFSVPVGVPLLLGPFYWNDGGYQWLLDAGDQAEMFEVRETVADVVPKNLPPGSTGNPRFYIVEGLKQGSYLLKLSFQRPWNGETLESYTVRITVTE